LNHGVALTLGAVLDGQCRRHQRLGAGLDGPKQSERNAKLFQSLEIAWPDERELLVDERALVQ
jgi:hypothetical protein